MKKISLYSLLVAVVLLGGCAQKDVEVDTTKEVAQKPVPKKEVPKKEVPKKEVPKKEKIEEITSEATLDKIEQIEEKEEVQEEEATRTIEDIQTSLQSIYFAFDKYHLTDEMREITKKNYEKLTTIEANTKIKLEGNCDEWGSDEYNYALGLRRTNTVKQTLIADGIASEKIIMVSYGESNPVCTEHNRVCWKKNRRVDHKLLP